MMKKKKILMIKSLMNISLEKISKEKIRTYPIQQNQVKVRF